MKGQQLSNSSSNSGTKSRKGATSIKGNLHTTSTPSSGKGKARTARSSSTSVASCLACGTIVTNDVRALQCDGYSVSTTWKCAECLNLTNNVYDQLVSGCDRKWLCSSCEWLKISSQDEQDKNATMLDQITDMLQMLTSDWRQANCWRIVSSQ